MTDTARKPAPRIAGDRPAKRGMARFEVLGLEADREMIRTLARRLAENDTQASELREKVVRSISDEPPRKGGIFAALRRSPLVGANLDLTRPFETGRALDT